MAAITTSRIWIGLSSGNLRGADTPTQHLAAFRYSTGVPDTNWQACTNDNVGAPTCTDTGIPAFANNVRTFRIDLTASSARFYMSGSLVATRTTDLPGSTTILDPQAQVTTLDNVTRTLNLGWMTLDHQ